MNRMT